MHERGGCFKGVVSRVSMPVFVLESHYDTDCLRVFKAPSISFYNQILNLQILKATSP